MLSGSKGASAEPGALSAALISVGCRTNQEETVTLRRELALAGFTIAPGPESADFIIVNTCSVTAGAESKVKRLLRSLSRGISPGARIAVTGCLAQQRPRDLLRRDRVAWVIGNARKRDIPAILKEGREGIFWEPLDRTPLSLPRDVDAPSPESRTRFSIKIQEGCDRACAYCIVPRLRGPSRCAPAREVLDACRKALDAGYKEIVLTGTHIGQFRDGERGLWPLAERVLSLRGDFRVRLSSLDPRELTDELLSAAGGGKKMCDHLHISLQSLSAEVLTNMQRPYRDLDALTERLVSFRARYPFAGIGADFIVGFPGETDSHFETTVRLADRIGFSYAHVFRFSARPGTEAALLSDQTPESIKTERGERLRAVVKRSRERFIRSHRGRSGRIIVEREHPLRGITSNYLSVEVRGPVSVLHNQWLDVILEGSDGGRFCGARPLPSEER